MPIDFENIRNKQRIIITGNDGTDEIIHLSMHVLRMVNKPFDYILTNGKKQVTDAPIVLIQGDDHLSKDKISAQFSKFRHHIAVIHHVEDGFPDEYASIDDYIAQYENLADNTPKGGTVVYNKEDNLAMVIGEKNREDVTLIEYESLSGKLTDDGYLLNGGTEVVKSSHRNFLSHAGAVLGLLRRISIPEQDILKALTSYESPK